ncbi:MAG: GGDEF domain-containing protein [Bacilli bacterium]|nr:GGDEF domain-containing protein [Bacilli bacterium]
MRAVYLAAALIGVLMLLLQFGIVSLSNIREAENTTIAYVNQTEAIVENNKREGEVLLASVKEDYIRLTKAVAHYLDNDPDSYNDINELLTLCNLMEIDEIHIFNEEGLIVSSSVAKYVNVVSMYDEGQIQYFLPMLEDKTLSMCQDVTPNSAEGKPMMYAITWNATGTYMVQIGIEAVRLDEVLKANEISAIVEDMAIGENMAVIVADAATLEVKGSSRKGLLNRPIGEVTSLNADHLLSRAKQVAESESKNGHDFSTDVTVEGISGRQYCSIGYMEDYVVCVFLSSSSFLFRTLLPLLIVAVYLAAALFIVIMIFRRLMASREENIEHLQLFASMSEIYYSLHLVDLKKNTAVEYSSKNQVKDAFNKPGVSDATKLMVGIMHATMSDEYLERGLAFADISTLSERLKGKKIISMELLGKNVGWIRMSFINFEEEDGVPTKAVIATQIIDEEKKAAEALYRESHVDELTGCYNRRAFNADAMEYDACLNDKEFAFVSFDVNGLKTINDDLGHEAGDELIKGASECMNAIFGKHGRIYRTGGDEFIGLIDGNIELMKNLAEEFDKRVASWHGKQVKELTVSYGYVHSSEAKGKTMLEIADLADKRMYESKAQYYKCKGIDRRRT